MAADAAGVVTQGLKVALQLANSFVLAAVAQQRGIGRGGRGNARAGVNTGSLVKGLERILADDTVRLERVALLEILHGGLGQIAEMAGDLAGVQLEGGQCGLDGGDLIGFVADAVGLGQRAAACQYGEETEDGSDPSLFGSKYVHEGINLLSILTICSVYYNL